jgi:hypothetical protein
VPPKDLKSFIESHLTEYKRTKSSRHLVSVAAAITVSLREEELLDLMHNVTDMDEEIGSEAHASGCGVDDRWEPREAFENRSLTRSIPHPVAIHWLALKHLGKTESSGRTVFRLLASTDVEIAKKKTTDLNQWDELLQVASRGWAYGEVRAFAVGDPKDYRVYRLYINDEAAVFKCSLLTLK